MAIKADFHLHSNFSGDSEASMESMILKGIENGLQYMCFTEHMDFEFPVSDLSPQGRFELNTDSYLYDLLSLRGKYRKQIDIRYGVELGMQAHLADIQEQYAASCAFDFIIGSSHLCNGRDPYQKDFFENRSEEAAYREYFSSIIDNLNTYSNFDVYGHLDYIVRYGPQQDRNYTYDAYADLFDEMLELIIGSGKGIEVNTGGIGYGLKDLHPFRPLLKRYKEKGGDIITIGSDAHRPNDICRSFERAEEVLRECGFRYYTVFKERSPQFLQL